MRRFVYSFMRLFVDAGFGVIVHLCKSAQSVVQKPRKAAKSQRVGKQRTANYFFFDLISECKLGVFAPLRANKKKRMLSRKAAQSQSGEKAN